MKMTTVNKTIPIKLIWMDSNNEFAKAVDYDVKYSLRTEQGEQSYSEAFISQNISFTTINDFLFSQVHQSIVYDKESKGVVENAFSSYTNNFIFLPKLSEAVLLSALHCKLNSICHSSSIVEVVDLDDTSDSVCYSHFNEDLEYEHLPSMDKWLGDKSFWKTPWWMRKDFSTFDNVALTDEEWNKWSETDQQELIARMAEPIREIEEEVRQALTTEKEEKAKGTLIEIDFEKRTKFKPKLVPKPKK